MPVEPQVRVFQELRQLPTTLVQPLEAFLFGPEYDLHRYNVAAEKGEAAAYDPTLGLTLKWLEDLGRRAGATVDQDYTRVFLEGAALRYWESAAAGQTPQDEKNKIRISGVNLVDKPGYARNVNLYNRDVQIGDYVTARASVDGTLYEGSGRVTGFEAQPTAAAVKSPSAANGNQVNSVAAAPTPTTGTDNSSVGSVDITVAGTYDGLADGILSETYTVTVRRGSTGGSPGTMILDITSLSGTDDQLGVVPSIADFSGSIALGTRGLTFSFDLDTTTDVATGNIYTVTVAQSYTTPTLTANSTYTGKTDTTYVVEVLEGGDGEALTEAGRPLLRIFTTTGVDSSGNIRYAASPVALGNHGTTLTFSLHELSKGDRFYVPVQAAGEGAVQTVVLDRSLPDELVTTSGGTVPLNVSLSIYKDTELYATLFDLGQTNWTQNGEQITFNPGAKLYDEDWRSGEHALEVIRGDVYVHWRELVSDNSTSVLDLDALSDIEQLLGTPIDPDNPLAYAAAKAIANSNGATVHVMGVPSDDLAGYQSVLDLAENRNDLYTLVPLTHDQAVWDLVEAHVNNMSSPENNRYRTAIFAATEQDPAPVVDLESDDSPVLATLGTDRYLDLDTGSGINLIEAGTRSGDKVRINYSADLYGNPTWDEFTVDSVLSETRLRTTTGPSVSIDTASKIEIWRNLTADDVIDQVGALANGIKNRRVTLTFPGRVKSGGVMVDGVHFAAAIAGLRSGVAPHQGLTNVEVTGFDDMANVTGRFSRSQLNRLSDFGVWIATQDNAGTSVYTRHAITTDLTGLSEREEMLTRNLDSISFYLFRKLAKYIGRSNVTESTTKVLRTQLDGGISFLQSQSQTELLGGQLIDGTVAELRPHAVLGDRYVIRLDLILPYPANNIDLTLVVGPEE